jgi:hypothetical protein
MANIPPRRPGLSSKIDQTELGQRGVASAPSPDPGQGHNKSSITTYFTKPPRVGEQTPVLYSGDRLWARVTLTLETAGPVAVGQMANISPVLSGKGQLLDTGVPTYFDIAKGTKLYIASTSVNRVKVSIQSVPWAEQITGLLHAIMGRLMGAR